ncbi:MAG: hypothetical protein EOO65_01210 [Methanosarcinales archaeon]|nr:MAG: hypothetical protein EOO65_01210 [Methanosarcinales archaeon]
MLRARARANACARSRPPPSSTHNVAIACVQLATVWTRALQIAQEFNIAVVLTNQVTADPGNMFVPDAKKPVRITCTVLARCVARSTGSSDLLFTGPPFFKDGC